MQASTREGRGVFGSRMGVSKKLFATWRHNAAIPPARATQATSRRIFNYPIADAIANE